MASTRGQEDQKAIARRNRYAREACKLFNDKTGEFSQPNLAVELLIKAAELGDEESYKLLIAAHLSGKSGIQKDHKKAFLYAASAVARGHKTCLILLAQIYHDGEGVEKNLKMARDLYKRVTKECKSEKDKGKAYYGLYLIYNVGGDGVEMNKKSAEKALSYAVKLGFPKAQIINACICIQEKKFDKAVAQLTSAITKLEKPGSLYADAELLNAAKILLENIPNKEAVISVEDVKSAEVPVEPKSAAQELSESELLEEVVKSLKEGVEHLEKITQHIVTSAEILQSCALPAIPSVTSAAANGGAISFFAAAAERSASSAQLSS